MAKRAWKYWEPVFQADELCEMNPVWPWGGHRRFAYDLVRWMRPARIAELGVHWGTSFFTFAQAVKDGRMKETELVGVDTFEGEDHAGRYGPEILDTVRRIVAQHFGSQRVTLHKMLFREALGHVADGSVDLLHIDGLHTYEAVKDDFETWLPKLAPEGVVLFHDVAPNTGYGSTDYWNELSARHPSFAFEHSWGLGVLFPKGDGRLAELRRSGLDDKILVYTSLARAERASREVHDLTRMAEDRAEGIRKQTEMIRQRDESLEKARASLADARSRAEAAERLARERQEAAQKHSEAARARNDAAERMSAQLENARKLAEDRLAELRQARAAAAEAAKLEPKLAAAAAARDELRLRVEELRERIRVQDERLAQGREDRRLAAERIENLREQNAKAREALASMEALRKELAASHASHRALDARLAGVADALAGLVASHEHTRSATATDLAALRAAVEESRRGAEATAAAIAQRVRRLDTDTELLGLRAEHLEEIVGRQREQPERSEPTPGQAGDWLTGPAQPPRAKPRSPRKR
ncbi:MAG TPA: class I SAM-dependent methyltransferase [Phycisphaerales bacterium]|nr:class I SAM-dependent methyltransferase [Phycisphaerales bacterium]